MTQLNNNFDEWKMSTCFPLEVRRFYKINIQPIKKKKKTCVGVVGINLFTIMSWCNHMIGETGLYRQHMHVVWPTTWCQNITQAMTSTLIVTSLQCRHMLPHCLCHQLFWSNLKLFCVLFCSLAYYNLYIINIFGPILFIWPSLIKKTYYMHLTELLIR